MWKWLKLGTLAFTTILTAWLSFPTWENIVATPQSVTWVPNDDGLTVLFDRTKVVKAETFFSTILISTTETRSDEPELKASMSQKFLLQPSLSSTPVYLLASGQVPSVVDSCIANGGIAGLRKLDDTEAAQQGLPLGGENDYTPRVTIYEETVLASDDPNPLRCEIDPHFFTSLRGSRTLYQAPTLDMHPAADLGLQPEEVLPTTDLTRADAVKAPASYCVGSIVEWGAGVTPGTPAPAAESVDEEDSTLVGNGFQWSNCWTNTGNPDLWEYVISRSSPSVDLTDNGIADTLNRNIFFAGIFLGVVGALVIEVLNTGFEIGESRAERHRLRREEEASPPSPAPDTEQDDRDQLPLF